MSVFFETETGSTYEISDGSIRRVPAEWNGKRADGEWVLLRATIPQTPTVGHQMMLVLESLNKYGPDDHGTRTPDPDVTTRLTTRVVKGWET